MTLAAYLVGAFAALLFQIALYPSVMPKEHQGLGVHFAIMLIVAIAWPLIVLVVVGMAIRNRLLAWRTLNERYEQQYIELLGADGGRKQAIRGGPKRR